MSQSFGIRKSILFSLIICFTFFLLLEVITRIVFPFDQSRYRTQKGVFQSTEGEVPDEFVREDPDLFWAFHEGVPEQKRSQGLFSTFFTNSDGLRDEEFKKDKSRTRTVLCLGDSCTFGVKIPASESYPEKLEDKLNGKFESKHIQVINAGVPGYSSFQGMQFFKKKFDYYNPDILVLQFGLNDRSIWNDLSDKIHYDYFKSSSITRVLSRSYLYLYLKRYIMTMKYRQKAKAEGSEKNWKKRKKKKGKKRAFANENEKRDFYKGALPRVSLDEYRANLQFMISRAAQSDCQTVLINWPLKAQVMPPYNEPNPYQQKLVRFAEVNSIPIVDLLTVLKDQPASIWLDRFHVNGSGNDLVSQALFEKIIPILEKKIDD